MRASVRVRAALSSVNTTICLAVGAAPEAVHNPSRLAELIVDALRQLQIDTGTTPDSEKS